MKKIALLLFVFIAHYAVAQQIINVDKAPSNIQSNFYTVGGQPVVTAKYVRLVSGSPFFRDQWMKGIATSENGTTYNGDHIKLDLIADEVWYLDGDVEKYSTIKLKELTLIDPVTNASYRLVHSSTLPATGPSKKYWYQYLVAGKAGLYKLINKNMSETRPYGSATFEQIIRTSEDFYILKNDQLFPVKKAKDLPNILSDKKTEIETFLKNDKGSVLQDLLVSTINYYNSLSK